MEIKYFKEKIFLFICLIFLIKTELMIIGPSKLSEIFNKQPIEIAFRKNQENSNFYVYGQIIFENATIMHSACSNLGPISPKTNQNDYSENFHILLAYNGQCPILQKARNAQNSGFSMLLLINNNDQDINSIFLDDDDSGNDIKIPIALISLENGKKFQNFFENYPKFRIIVEINFQKNSSEKKKIEFKLFFSSSELKAYELINKITKKYNKLFEHVNFIPIYITHQSPAYNPEIPVKEINCVSRGKYCYFPKETTIVQDGQKILLESLRQKCMFIKNEGKINKYFDYMNKFYSLCLETKRFNERCTHQILDSLGYPINYLDNCIAESFGVNNLLSNSYIENDNSIFKKDYDEILKYKITSFPFAVIDDKPFKGIIKEKKIMLAICNSLNIKQGFCNLLFKERDYSLDKIILKKSRVYILIISIIGINIILFLKFKKYIMLKLNEKIDYNKIDIDGRIKTFVQNYISLQETQGNDYQSFENNSSSNKKMENNQIVGSVNTI